MTEARNKNKYSLAPSRPGMQKIVYRRWKFHEGKNAFAIHIYFPIFYSYIHIFRLAGQKCKSDMNRASEESFIAGDIIELMSQWHQQSVLHCKPVGAESSGLSVHYCIFYRHLFGTADDFIWSNVPVQPQSIVKWITRKCEGVWETDKWKRKRTVCVCVRL